MTFLRNGLIGATSFSMVTEDISNYRIYDLFVE